MRLIRPLVDKVTVTVRGPEPIGSGTVSSLNAQAGEGIRGRRGTIRYGLQAPGTRLKYGGYVFPAQMFLGYDPRKVAAGAVRNIGTSLPSTSAPVGTYSPLTAAMAAVTGVQGGNKTLGGL